MKKQSALNFWIGTIVSSVLIFGPGIGAVAAAGKNSFDTPLTPNLLDNNATAQWVAGQEISRRDFLSGDSSSVHFPNQLTWLVVLPGSQLGWGGISFGAETQAGPRHLRVGIKEPVAVGTVITRGNITALSVLKKTAKYPGDLGNDEQWIPAISQMPMQATSSDDAISLWILPHATTTQAIRLTYQSPAGKEGKPGKLLGMYVMASRYENLAPEAFAFASNNSKAAPNLLDCSREGWSNGDKPQRAALSAEEPEWITLTWPSAVTLRGICAIKAVFGKTEIQTYIGPKDKHPRESSEKDWQTVATGICAHRSPECLNLNWFDFGRDITTRAVRLRILSSTEEGHYLKGQTLQGRRCMLGGILALSSLGADSIAARHKSEKNETVQDAIPISFSMASEGFVTLVIEDEHGTRVRNLIGETYFPAGKHTVYWDGLDEGGRIDGPYAGIYKTVGRAILPGNYTVRGLVRPQLDLSYEFTVCNTAGTPPWLTASQWSGGTGGWLADHSSPSAVLFLPGDSPRLLMASPVSESNHGIIWTDLKGKKLDGKLWVGGNWSGASHLARDAGSRAKPDVYAYSGIAIESELRLVSFAANAIAPIVVYKFPEKKSAALNGIAVHNGLLVASLPKLNVLLFVDTKSGKILGTAALTDPRGLAFDSLGRLLAIVGKQLVVYPANAFENLSATDANNAITLPQAQTLIASDLLDPQGLTLDVQDNIFISDWGASHQVKIFTKTGQLTRKIGQAGGARLGAYDPTRMDHPLGMTVTPQGRLWVAESSVAPKRVSEWNLDGELMQAFYGPPQYGGGGTIDARDPKRFYFAEQGQKVGLEFSLDWNTGNSRLSNIYFLQPPDALAMPGDTAPQTPIYLSGRQYMTDVNNSRPIGGPSSASIWLMDHGVSRPVASLGMAKNWPVVCDESFRERWPQGLEPKKNNWDSVMYAWSDLNADGQVSPNEVTFKQNKIGSLTLNDQMQFCTAGTEVFAPESFTPQGVPIFDVTKSRRQLENFFMNEVGSQSGQIVAAHQGWTVGTGGPVKGIRDGRIVWTYPNEWPGQQAGVFSNPPTHPGELMATTRHMGLITPPQSDVGEVLVVNGDKGNVFLMSTDGLFVATLFHDLRLGAETWTMPVARRGMLLNDITLYDEDFWPTATQTPDGKVYLVVGKSHSSIVRVDHLEKIRRLNPWQITVTSELLDEAQRVRMVKESQRLLRVGRDRLNVRLAESAPTVDGALNDWLDDEWVTIEENNNKRLANEAGGKVEAAARVAGDRLFVAYKTKEPNLLANAGDAWQMLFKTGGALDVMLGCSPTATPDRTAAQSGDLRLLVTLIKDKPIAVLYKPVSPDNKKSATFSSPWRSVVFDRVEDVSTSLVMANKNGIFEFSIPLSMLDLKPVDGMEIRGDIGILRGNGFQTIQRIYWQNKSTSTVADVPTEATLTPHLWGIWRFKKVPASP